MRLTWVFTVFSEMFRSLAISVMDRPRKPREHFAFAGGEVVRLGQLAFGVGSFGPLVAQSRHDLAQLAARMHLETSIELLGVVLHRALR